MSAGRVLVVVVRVPARRLGVSAGQVLVAGRVLVVVRVLARGVPAGRVSAGRVLVVRVLVVRVLVVRVPEALSPPCA